MHVVPQDGFPSILCWWRFCVLVVALLLSFAICRAAATRK
jgi:hypothetical protein